MRTSSSNTVGPMILKALGVEHRGVKRATIFMIAGSPIEVDVVYNAKTAIGGDPTEEVYRRFDVIAIEK